MCVCVSFSIHLHKETSSGHLVASCLPLSLPHSPHSHEECCGTWPEGQRTQSLAAVRDFCEAAHEEENKTRHTAETHTYML